MDAKLRFAAKACLVTAASGLLYSQVTALPAQDGDAPAGQPAVRAPSVSAKVQQAQAYAPVTKTSAQAPLQQDSAVQKELQKLYKKNNGDMPSFSIDDAPNTQGPMPPQQAGGANPQATPVASAVPAANQPKANWFERTFHVGRGKRKPAPAAEYAAPASPRAPGYRMTVPSATARPALPNSRAPIAAAPVYQAPPSALAPSVTPPPLAAGPTATAQPAQPQLREPAPLAPSPAARELTVKAQPPAVHPRRDSKPLLDESGMNDDGESLDLADSEPQTAERAPQINSNRSDDKAPSDSPYSGLKIAPNEEERQISRRPQAALDADGADADDDIEASAEGSQTTAKGVQEQSPAPAETPAASEPAATKTKAGISPLDDEEDEDDDEDDDLLLLPSAKSSVKPHALPEPAVLKAEKVLEKMAVPVAAAPAPAVPANAGVPAPATLTSAEAPVPPAPAVPVPDAAAPAPAPLPGLKGVCPVALKDSRKLIEARPTILSIYKGKTFAFSSVEAKQAFDENPQKYAPAGCGTDVVKLIAGEKDVEGTLEHAAWYRGRLYLFSTAESRHEFVDTPSKFVIED